MEKEKLIRILTEKEEGLREVLSSIPDEWICGDFMDKDGYPITPSTGNEVFNMVSKIRAMINEVVERRRKIHRDAWTSYKKEHPGQIL